MIEISHTQARHLIRLALDRSILDEPAMDSASRYGNLFWLPAEVFQKLLADPIAACGR